MMATDSGNGAGGRRARRAAGDGYHPSYLAAKHRITVQQARDLIAEIGPDRERLNHVANVVRIVSGR